jgi:MarR family transcriptional regulator, negative regulator of the multidrug operon emrRAB
VGEGGLRKSRASGGTRVSSAAPTGVGDRRTANLLGALALAVVDRVYEAAEEVGVGGPSASAAMTTLFTYQDVAPRALAVVNVERLRRVLGLSHSATVRLVDRLTEAGFIVRGSGDDGREVALHLTPAGRRAAKRILRERQRVLDRALGVLDFDERNQLSKTLERLLAAITYGRWDARNICRLCDHALCHNNPSCPVAGAATALGE